jgi:uncharacterized protein with von Willebrand factor type A (vWA) domain
MPAKGSGLEFALVGFGLALRKEGLVVGSGHIITYCEVVEKLDPTELADLYYGGRSCLIHRPNDIPMYNRVFKAYFLDPGGEGSEIMKMKQSPSEETEAVMEMLQEEEDKGTEREGDARGPAQEDLRGVHPRGAGGAPGPDGEVPADSPEAPDPADGEGAQGPAAGFAGHRSQSHASRRRDHRAALPPA